MKPKPINRLAMWLPMKIDTIEVKVFDDGYPFTEGNVIIRSSKDYPVYRYAKNYEAGAGETLKKYSLCIISNEANISKMEQWLDAKAASIDPADVEGKFKLLDASYVN